MTRVSKEVRFRQAAILELQGDRGEMGHRGQMATQAGHGLRESPLSLVPGKVGGVRERVTVGEEKARHYRVGLALHVPFPSLLWSVVFMPSVNSSCSNIRFCPPLPPDFPTAELSLVFRGRV